MTERELLMALVSNEEAGMQYDNCLDATCIYCDGFFEPGISSWARHRHSVTCPLRLARELLGVKMKGDKGE